jgi:hypothetical protein
MGTGEGLDFRCLDAFIKNLASVMGGKRGSDLT